MKVLTDSNTTVELDPIEWFDVEWHTNDGEYQRARVVEIKRNTYPAQGGGHGCVVFGVGYRYLKTGLLAKRTETIHGLRDVVDQIPPVLRAKLDEQGIFDEIEEADNA